MLGVLGTGGTATVYKVRDTALDVERALKVLRVGNADLGRRLAAEARTMVRLANPHILRVVDVGEDEGRPYLVMEYLSGGTLADLSEAGPLPVKSALGWTLQVLAALSASHEQGIIHRDVKPSNILLDDKGVAHLADFGIAMRSGADEERSTRTGVALGTLAFMAPEQRLDARSVSEAADLYAVGATLYALLTYRSSMDLFVVQHGDARLKGIPLALETAIVRATRYQPEDRYQSAAEMATDLWALHDGASEAPLVTPETGAPPPVRVRTATPGPLAERMRPSQAVIERAVHTMDGVVDAGGPASPPTSSPTPQWALLGGVVGAIAALLTVAFLLPFGGPKLEPSATLPAVVVEAPSGSAPVSQPVSVVVEPNPTPTPTLAVAPAPIVVAPVVRPTAPAPAPVPRPALQTHRPFPAGRYAGVLDGRPIELSLSGEPGALDATIRAWFSEGEQTENNDNSVSRSLVGRWDAETQVLLLTDDAAVSGGGSIRATWDGRRFLGQFVDRRGTHRTTFEARPQ